MTNSALFCKLYVTGGDDLSFNLQFETPYVVLQQLQLAELDKKMAQLCNSALDYVYMMHYCYKVVRFEAKS